MSNVILIVFLFAGWMTAGYFWIVKRNLARQGRRFAGRPLEFDGGTHLAALLDNVPMACILLDIHYRVTEWNRQAETLFGLIRDDVLGCNMIELMVPSDKNESIRDAMAASTALGRKFCFSFPRRFGGGEMLEVELLTAVLRDGAKKPYGIITMAMDITERKRMEDALWRSSESLAESQRTAHVGSWVLYLADSSRTCSDEIYSIFEIDREKSDASCQVILSAIHPDDREAVNRAYTELQEAQSPYDIEYRVHMPDGWTKFVHEHCETRYDLNGKPLCFLGTVQDITERKLADTQLYKLEQELRALAEKSPVSSSCKAQNYPCFP